MRRKAGALVPLEIAILSVVARLNRREIAECYGYQIAKRLREASEQRLLTAYGTLYRALARLEQMGLLESRWEDPQTAMEQSRPARRLYSLTDAGIAMARGAQTAESAQVPKPRRALGGRRKPARA